MFKYRDRDRKRGGDFNDLHQWNVTALRDDRPDRFMRLSGTRVVGFVPGPDDRESHTGKMRIRSSQIEEGEHHHRQYAHSFHRVME
jgi:hypothetical protein